MQYIYLTIYIRHVMSITKLKDEQIDRKGSAKTAVDTFYKLFKSFI